jgi:dTDP-4-dehydrorhamnose reductase
VIHCEFQLPAYCQGTDRNIGAANRFPDKCDVDPEGARALNVEATASLVRNTVARNIFIVYISTDYVFPGKEGDAPYEVDACTAPPNLYGQTKLDGENAVLEQAGVKHLGVVLRVPVLYGQANYPKESAVNALQESVWRAQERDIRIEMDDWALRYPTNTEDVGRVCKDLAVKYLGSSESQRESFPTVLHFSSEDRFTKYEICQLMAEILGLPLIGMTANKTGNAPHGIQRPYDSHLSSSELEKLGIPIWTQDFKAWW